MFTKEDYDHYFDQIARVERKMIYGVYDLGREIDDPSITRVLQKIGDDEVRHYGYVLKMLKMTADPGRFEHRREAREYYLGTILMRSLQEPKLKGVKAYCVNLSKTGICLECAQDLSVGGTWDLEIRLFDEDEARVHRGRVVWSKRVEPDFYISGIAFDA